jgi:predicted transcriptional regulator
VTPVSGKGRHDDGDDRDPRTGPGGRDEEAVRQFVERFATVLVEAGMARMPARVFCTLLATDSGQLTAAELGERLHVSPAAVSGAMRYLVQVNLASRGRQPGSRRDVYRVHDDLWLEAAMQREQMFNLWEATLRVGIQAVGPDTPAGHRLRESSAFIDFYREELPNLLTRWRQRQSDLRNNWS